MTATEFAAITDPCEKLEAFAREVSRRMEPIRKRTHQGAGFRAVLAEASALSPEIVHIEQAIYHLARVETIRALNAA